MLFVLSFATASSDFLLLLTLFVMVSVLVIILVYDVLHTIIPDSLVVLLTLSAGIIVVVTKIPVETAVLSAFSTSVFLLFFGLYRTGGGWDSVMQSSLFHLHSYLVLLRRSLW